MEITPIIILCSEKNCPGAEPISSKEDIELIERAAIKAFVTFEDGYYNIDCPDLSIHVSDPNCSKAQAKLESAIMDYYQVLRELPEEFMGETQRYHMDLYENALIPAIARYLVERGQLLEKPSFRDTFQSLIRRKTWSPLASKLVRC